MALDDTPNKLESVWIQRNTENQFYEQVNISGSDLIIYHSSSGELMADKINVWAAKYGLGGGAGGTTVKVDINDTTAGYLNAKLVAGNNISFSINSPGGNETITVDAIVGTSDQATLATSSLVASSSLITSGSFPNLTAPGALSQLVTHIAGNSTFYTPTGIWVEPTSGEIYVTASQAISASIATTAVNPYVDLNHGSGQYPVVFTIASTGYDPLYADPDSLNYNPDTGLLEATAFSGQFSGSLHGTASQATTASYVDPTAFNNLFFPLEFVYKNTTSAGDPGNGNFRYDSLATSSVTQIYLDYVTNGGIDVSRIIRNLISGSTQIYIQEKTDASKASLFEVNGTLTDNTGWFTIPVLHITSSTGGLPTNNKACAFLIINRGVVTGGTYAITSSQAVSASHADSSSYALNSNTVYVFPDNSTDFHPVVLAQFDDVFPGYVDLLKSSMSYQPSSDTLRVTNLRGTASRAVTASRADTASLADVALVAFTSSHALIAETASVSLTASAVRFEGTSHRIIGTKRYVSGYKDIGLGNSYTNALTLNLSSSNNVVVRTSLHGYVVNTGSVMHTSEYLVNRAGLTSATIDGYAMHESHLPQSEQVVSGRMYYDDNPNNIYLQYKIPASTLSGSFTYEVRGLFADVDNLINPYVTLDPTYGSASSETSFYSPFEFQTITARDITTDAAGLPWSASATMSYAEILGHCTSMSVSYPSRITYDTSMMAKDGVSVIPALIIDDDGFKPVITIYHGIHGTERPAAHGLFRFLYDYLDPAITNDPFFNDARDRFTLVVFPCAQPWGWQNNQRENSNGVDLNRNSIYGWIQTVDPDKGTTPNSEENGTMQAFLFSQSYYSRQIVSVDSHGWGYYGQWWYGYLVQQQWYTLNNVKAQRSHYLYLNHLLDNRLTTSFYTNNNLEYGLRGNDGMRAAESRGALKPYVNNNGLPWTNPNCYRILGEHAQYFNGGSSTTGSLGESASICSIQKYDTFHAALACASEFNQMLSGTVATYHDAPAMKPLNSNSLFQAWNTTEQRPDWTLYSKLYLTQSWEPTANMYYTRATFPAFTQCPTFFSEAGYLTMSYSGSPYIVIIGGNGNTSTYNATAFVENLSNGSHTVINTTSVGKSCTIVTDGSSSLWRVGGFYTGSSYLNRIWRAELSDVFSGSSISWSIAGTMTSGVQRHTSHYWVNPNDNSAYILVIGGRQADGYTSSIYKYRVDDNSYTETLMTSELSTSRAWCSSAISASMLFVFGGYNGSTTYNGTRKIDLINDIASNGTVIPGTRKEMAAAVDPDNPHLVYLVFGNSGTGAPTGSIFRYNMSSDLVSTINYTIDYGSEENSSSVLYSDVAKVSPAAAIYDGTLYIYGGGNPSGSYHDDVYTMDLNDLILSNRLTVNDATYGYLKISNHASSGIFNNTVVGDVFTAVVDIRRSSGSVFNGTTDPYIRIVWKTGSDSYNPLRKNMSGKFVPSTDWQRFSLPLRITSSLETSIQAPYIRSYVAGESFDIKGFQVFKGSMGKIGRIVAQEGESMLTASRQFIIPLDNTSIVEKTVRFEPYFGSNSSVDLDLIQFNLSASSQVTNMVLHYSASVTSSRPPVSVDYATWYDSVPTGQFDLRWIDNDGQHTASFLQNAELNHASDRLEGHRRDNVSLRFNTSASAGFTASMWFKGRTNTTYITKSIYMTGFDTKGVGMLLYDDVSI